MELIDITLIWLVIIALGILMYILLDGFDLGVGILFPFAPGEAARDDMMNSVAPVWDGNETWLVLVGAGLLAAFPLVYSIYLPALYIGVFLMLAGLIFRGVAFEFRFKAGPDSRPLWNIAFAAGSAVAGFAQGVVVGAYIEGFEVEGLTYLGGPFDLLTPFTLFCGLALVAGYALLGATWLILKTEDETQEWAYRITPPLLGVVLAALVVISLWTPIHESRVFARWLDGWHLLWPLPLLGALSALLLYRSVRRRLEGYPFIATLGIFVSAYAGLLASKWPYMVPPDITFRQAASAPESQLFLLLGVLFILPVILGYTAWTYWIFRGKVKPGAGYH